MIVVTTGRASYYKGIDFFIECANELINNQNIDQLHFLFCGDGPDMANFQKLTSQFKLDSHFTFAGKRTDIRKILPSCNIGFHTSTGEVGYSLSILEYMSAGLVTIVPDRPSTSLAISHMENGLLYKPENLQSATDAIKIALTEVPGSTLRNNAAQCVHENFNIRDTNKALTEILDRVFK